METHSSTFRSMHADMVNDTLVSRLRELAASFVAMLPGLAAGLIVFLLFWLVSRMSRRVVQRILRRHSHAQLVSLVIARLASGMLFIAGLLVGAVVAFPSFTPAAMIQLLGISSVAFGFAFRDVLQNYLAGILLLLDGTFQIGDQVLFSGSEGTIEDIQTRATLIRTFDGRLVVVPNGMLFTGIVTVTSRRRHLRSECDVILAKVEDAARAIEIARETVRTAADVIPDPPPRAFVQDTKGQGAIVRIQWWTEPEREKLSQVRTSVLLAVRKAIRDAGIEVT